MAPTAAYYTTGEGEAAGRWTGSLAAGLGLHGEIDPGTFRKVLAGIHPHTGEWFYSAQGSNARARTRQPTTRTAPAPAALQGFDAARVAVQLQVSVRAVRYWLQAGETVAARLVELTPGLDGKDPDALTARLEQLITAGSVARPQRPYLFSTATVDTPRAVRVTSPSELDRFQARRNDPAAARAGFDVVFRPPKSYSVMWAIGGPELTGGIADAHRQAVDDALRYLEDAAALTRVTAPTSHRRATPKRRVRAAGDGFIVAAFDHRDSRAGDPLLHTHCVIANVTRTTQSRRGHRNATVAYSALDTAALYRHARAADVIYNATFRHLCRRQLGIEHAPVRNGWADIAGFPRAVIEGMSKRSAEISQELERAGMGDSHQAREAAALASRQPKTHGQPGGDAGLHQRWAEETASRWAFTPHHAQRYAGTVRAAHQHHDLEPLRLAQVFDHLSRPDGLTAKTATFGRGEVIAALSEQLPHLNGPALLNAAHHFLASDRVAVITETRPGKPKARVLDNGRYRPHLPDITYTTPQLLAIEQRTISAQWRNRNPTSQHVTAALAEQPSLDPAQRDAVTQTCLAAVPLRVIVGYPGSGKTFVARTVADAYRNAGAHVVGCAVTATAADELARQAHIPTDTVARTLADLRDHDPLPRHSLVIVDEASTLNHWDLNELSEHARASEATVVLVGDPHQHGAVGPGHLFAWLARRDHGVATLTSNHRIAGPDLAEERTANHDYRTGNIRAALERRDRDGKIIRAATLPQLHQRITQDWAAAFDAGQWSPMLAPTNHTRQELNRLARQHLTDTSRLRGPVLHAAGIELQAGDHVIARHNDRRLRDPNQPDWWLRNGTRGHITAVHPDTGEMTVDFDGHHLGVPRHYLNAGHIEHAYALTDYLIQGRTLHQPVPAILDHSSTRAGAYVANTRSSIANLSYILDGSVAPPLDPELHPHQPPTVGRADVGLDELVAHLQRDTGPATLHDIDPTAAETNHHTNRRLHDLTAEAAKIDRALAAAPADLASRLAAAERTGDDQTARNRLLPQPTPDNGTTAKIRDALVEHQLRRAAFLAGHQPQIERRSLLRSAEAKRQIRLRLQAAATERGKDRDSPAGTLIGRRRQRDQAERQTIEEDRGGRP